MTESKLQKRALVREELVRVSKELCSKDDQSKLGLALRGVLPILDHAFILHWVPEQAEDIYWVLISLRRLRKSNLLEIEQARRSPFH